MDAHDRLALRHLVGQQGLGRLARAHGLLRAADAGQGVHGLEPFDPPLEVVGQGLVSQGAVAKQGLSLAGGRRLFGIEQ